MKLVTIGKAIAPDKRTVTKIQAARLASLTGAKLKELEGNTIAQLSEKFKWKIDPELFLFRRICGRVVKKDPVTGAEYPVPYATVHVEDTDCNLLGFFPGGSPWSWFFPFFCRREEIATVTTDACGRFCAYIPRWEIDWILRFRLERLCFPEIFIKPSIRDILEGLRKPPIIKHPIPEPDPVPIVLREGLPLQRLEDLFGREVAGKLASLGAGGTMGGNIAQQLKILDSKAFSQPLPPPLPARMKSEIADREMKLEAEEVAHEMSGKMLEEMSAHLNLEPKRLAGLNFGRYIGPFWRCRTWIVPEWYPIFDVPDITFRVTQDVDGDGDEEVIYSESLFDVRWNSGSIPDVKLEASQIALAGVACETPDDIPCENVPAILFAGLMPLVNPAIPYHDAASGYARRPNRPHASGSITPVPADFPLPPAQAPYTRTLQLYGCNNIDDAVHYRLTYSFNGGATVPFTGLTWPLHRVVGGVLQTQWTAPDDNGWYPVIPDSDGWFPSHLLLNWPTGGFQNGLYEVKLELGNAAKAVIDSSASVGFRIDNSYPTAQFTGLRWRKVGDVWHDITPYFCPVIHRPVSGGVPADIEIEVRILTSASHLRSTELKARGCGGTAPTRTSALSTAQHWHTSPADNTFISTAVFSLPGAAPQGAYSFDIHAIGRAFNPAGGDGGFEADWNYDPVYNDVWPSISLAVVNL